MDNTDTLVAAGPGVIAGRQAVLSLRGRQESIKAMEILGLKTKELDMP